MAKAKIETKTYLQFNFNALYKPAHLISIVKVEKSISGINIKNELLTKTGLEAVKGVEPLLYNTFLECTHPNLEYSLKRIENTYYKLNPHKSQEEFCAENYEKHVYDLIRSLYYNISQIKCYHLIKKENKNVVNSPCSFSKLTPQLSFKIIKKSNYLAIQTFIKLNDSLYELEQFVYVKFLLFNNNEYFCLKLTESKTLQWLAGIDFTQVGTTEEMFVQNVLTKLEENYAVDRNNLITKNIVEVLPESRIYFSEISGQFLMLTPQFEYDGILVEGLFKEMDIKKRGGTEFEIIRNKESETAFKKELESLHPNFKTQYNGYYYLSFSEAQKKQWFLRVYQQLLANDVKLVGMDMLKHFKYSDKKINTTETFISSNENHIELELKVCFDKESIPLIELQKTLRNGQEALLLKDGSIGVITSEWIAKYGLMLKHAQIEKTSIKVPKWLYVLDKETPNEEAKSVVPKGWRKRWASWLKTTDEVYKLPDGINATLRPYQQKGYEWLRLLNELGAGACLADDMGLGKTLQTICFLTYQMKINHLSHALIVCPTSLMYNWQAELQKFAPHLITHIYHGATRKKEDFESSHNTIFITSYGTLRSDEEFMQQFSFCTIILDESHNIKNPSSLSAKAVHKLNGLSRITLSGTPIMNNTFDLYSQVNFALPGLFGSREFFKREYADPIDIDRNPEKIEALKKLTAPFILRRTKEQVAKDLPPKTESILWCQMDANQRYVYNDILNQVRGNVMGLIKVQGLGKSKMHVLQAILKLRQVCNSPILLKDHQYSAFDESIKTKELMDELLNNLGNHKVLVFSQFTTMLDLLSNELDKNKISHFTLTGATPAKERQQMVDDFSKEESKVNVFLLSLKAGNTGLNLTAADYVFLFDPWWNTAVEQQAIDRTHRIGQTKNVFAYKMICKNTIEERIIQLQEKKKKISEELITEDDGFVKSLSVEDIEFLFTSN